MSAPTLARCWRPRGERRGRDAMRLVGYTDRLAVRPGDTVTVMVSAEVDSYEADLVRLFHGDPHPDGPGLKEEVIPGVLGDSHPGRRQGAPARLLRARRRRPAGARSRALAGDAGLRLRDGARHARRGPARPLGRGDRHGLCARARRTGRGRVGAGDGARVARISTRVALAPFTWYLVSAELDLAAGTVSLVQEPLRGWPLGPARTETVAPCDVVPATPAAPLTVGAWHDSSRPRWHDAAGHLNGKIDRPLLRRDGRTILEWDLSRELHTARVIEVSGNGADGIAVNMPMRGVTGHNFSGRETDFRLLPEEYGAIFFHDDDLEDARWEVDFDSGCRAICAAACTRCDRERGALGAAAAVRRPPRGRRPRPRGPAARPTRISPTPTPSEHPGRAGSRSDDLLRPRTTTHAQRLLSLYDHHATDRQLLRVASAPARDMRPGYVLAEIRGVPSSAPTCISWTGARAGLRARHHHRRGPRTRGRGSARRYRVVSPARTTSTGPRGCSTARALPLAWRQV